MIWQGMGCGPGKGDLPDAAVRVAPVIGKSSTDWGFFPSAGSRRMPSRQIRHRRRKKMKIRSLVLLTAAAMALSACLDNDLERGAAGAAAGVIIAETTDGNTVAGAVIDGAAGVLCDDVGVCN